jgi:hypothetical protein
LLKKERKKVKLILIFDFSKIWKKKRKRKKNYDCITYILQFLPSKRVEAKCGKQIQENQENTQVIK